MSQSDDDLSSDFPTRDPAVQRLLGRFESVASREYVREHVDPVAKDVTEVEKRVDRLEMVAGFGKWIASVLVSGLIGGAFFAFFRWIRL